ncbi:MAG: HDOD domain-containing protein [Candidatus Polarisedimenticolaceae bacterium]|nr:HDOD domain-containing protein [Candidatus Polarisedimenticolaceae bacterium]
MASTGMHPSAETLQRFHILASLSDDQLELLTRALVIKRAPRGKKVIELGATESFSFFLLDGDIALQAKDGSASKISHSDASAENPIAQLIPRLYDVIAITAIEFIHVDNRLLAGLTEHPDVVRKESEEIFLDYGVENTESTLEQCLNNDLVNERLYLPSLPDVAVKIGKALEDESTDAERIAKIIQTDVAMTAKIIHVANSAMYSVRSPADSCTAAVVRLGVHTTHRLVLSFALRELFRTKSGILKKHMKLLWAHSLQVSAISYVLAKMTGQFNPEHAMLAGLLHDIGEVAILTYAEKFPEAANDEAQMEQILMDMRGPVGSMILRSWDFSEDLIQVTEEAENWHRDIPDGPDYADLVNIAQLHCFIGTPRMHEMPMLDQVPAFHKLSLDEFSPEMSLSILEKASERLAETEALMSS